MGAFNARHPWNHNDAFHPWILTRLPESRRTALDIGCGRGEFLAELAGHFNQVHGTDIDETMRQEASARCAGLPNVTVVEMRPAGVDGQVDLVTMIAVLHHLDVERALANVKNLLSPGGRFLCVGLAKPVTLVDHFWDVASMVSNPVIGYVRHPWVAHEPLAGPVVPVKDPQWGFDELRAVVETVMPDARMRHRLGFRHTIEWTKPQSC